MHINFSNCRQNLDLKKVIVDWVDKLEENDALQRHGMFKSLVPTNVVRDIIIEENISQMQLM